jgi:hypothetical protein
MTPFQMLGMRPVARDLSLAIAQLAVHPYKLTRTPKDTKPYHWMLVQYRKVFDELLHDHGSPAAVGEQLYFDLGELAEVSR